MPNATGPRSAATAPTSCRCRASSRAPRSLSPKASCSRPTRPCARRRKASESSRVQQIVDWLGRDFDGVVVFDEAHAMANAAGDKGERGEKKPSQQGQAGSAPAARIARCAHPLCLGDRRDDGAEPRLCRPARPLGHRRFSVRDPRRVRRRDGRRRHRRDGGAGARSEGARPLCRALLVVRGHRIRDRRALA